MFGCPLAMLKQEGDITSKKTVPTIGRIIEADYMGHSKEVTVPMDFRSYLDTRTWF